MQKLSNSVVILIVIILLLYIQPNFLINFSNTLIGKAIFITLIILTTLQHNTCGLLLAVLFIVLLEYNFEGLSKAKQVKKKSKSGLGSSIPIEHVDSFEGQQLEDRMDDENSMKGIQN